MRIRASLSKEHVKEKADAFGLDEQFYKRLVFSLYSSQDTGVAAHPDNSQGKTFLEHLVKLGLAVAEPEAKENELVSFMRGATAEMQREYERIFNRTKEDPGTAGDEGEENWAELFRDWLPSNYHVVTKGRILAESGEASPQVDVLVLRPFYPRALLHKKLYLTAGVAAAFECKTTLKAAHILEAVKTGAEIRRLVKLNPGDALTELNSPIVYGLLAHSHSWKGEYSDPLGLIEETLLRADNEHVQHPRECLDVLCVSDLALWSSSKAPTGLETWTGDDGKPYYRHAHRVYSGYGRTWPGMFAEGTDVHRRVTAIGAMLARLMLKLSQSDPSLFDLGVYYRQSGIWGGSSLNGRAWPNDTLSASARRKVEVDGYLQKHWPYD